MIETGNPARARVGDVMVVSGHSVGQKPREGEILEVLGESRREHYRVRWEDGHESVFYPSSDAHVRHAQHDEAAAPSSRRRAGRAASAG